MNGKNLFRTEAINGLRQHWKGKALLLTGVPVWSISSLSALFILLFCIFLFFSKYTRRIDVSGEVITYPHAINVYAAQQGFVVERYVQVGDIVKPGTPLYRINVSTQTMTGNVNTSSREAIKKQITNIEKIIDALIINKKETLENLNNQLSEYSKNIKETQKMIASAREGVRKMQQSMSSYEKYRQEGLITNDQLNNQRYLFYQQQSGYQSLSSQGIQEKIQISQLRSQLITRAAEFDNNILENEHQKIQLHRSLIENEAGGDIIVNAQSSGRVESLSVTTGQMVSSGSSLAQIRPVDKINYYLIVWLPNSSLPYVKKGDGVNIRYDAFPSEKFGQFPGKVLSISSVPAAQEEISKYRSAPAGNNIAVDNYYKALIELKDISISDRDNNMMISPGLKAKIVVFLDTRRLYEWMFQPFYDVKNSMKGRIDG